MGNALAESNVEPISFKEYQDKAQETAIYPGKGKNLYYPTIGLNGEAGEVAEKVKKMMRDNGGVLSNQTREAIRKELGDVLWYITDIAVEIGSSLEDVARGNNEKLSSRKRRGVIKGNGDDR